MKTTDAPEVLETPVEFSENRVWIAVSPYDIIHATCVGHGTEKEDAFPVWVTEADCLAAFPFPVETMGGRLTRAIDCAGAAGLSRVIVFDSAWNEIDRYEVPR